LLTACNRERKLPARAQVLCVRARTHTCSHVRPCDCMCARVFECARVEARCARVFLHAYVHAHACVYACVFCS
jgi:hypothetical protein